MWQDIFFDNKTIMGLPEFYKIWHTRSGGWHNCVVNFNQSVHEICPKFPIFPFPIDLLHCPHNCLSTTMLHSDLWWLHISSWGNNQQTLSPSLQHAVYSLTETVEHSHVHTINKHRTLITFLVAVFHISSTRQQQRNKSSMPTSCSQGQCRVVVTVGLCIHFYWNRSLPWSCWPCCHCGRLLRCIHATVWTRCCRTSVGLGTSWRSWWTSRTCG